MRLLDIKSYGCSQIDTQRRIYSFNLLLEDPDYGKIYQLNI